MSNGNSWYQTGFDALAAEKERQESLYSADRFFMKEKTRASLVFIDDDPFTFYEHSYRKDGKWDDITCIARMHPDKPRCCERLGGDKSRHFVGMLTVLDCTEYKSKDGSKTYQYGVKLYPAKYKAMNILQRKRQDHTSLVHLKCAVYRDTDKDPNTGSELTFGEEVKDLDAMFRVAKYRGKLLSELWDKAESSQDEYRKLARSFQLQRGPDGRLVRRIPPLNYIELCAPKAPEEVTRILTGNVIGSGDTGKFGDKSGGPAGGASGPEDKKDVPF